MMYWAFTTVMTVGFGDYYPCSNFERMLGSAFMLSGVAYFTIIKDNFSSIYMFLKGLNEGMEEEESL